MPLYLGTETGIVKIGGVASLLLGGESEEEIALQEKQVVPGTSVQEIVPDPGYAGLSRVTVDAVGTEQKAVTPTKNQQVITPTSGKYLASVTVNAIPEDYIPADTVQHYYTGSAAPSASVGVDGDLYLKV